MRSVLQSLEAALESVRRELHLHEILTAALKVQYSNDAKALQEYDHRAQRLIYANTIISCYGLIEQTVDSMITVAAEAQGQIYDSYGEIPEKTRNNHRELLLACLRDRDRARTRGAVNERAALEALGRQAEGSANLVSTCFTLSTANYRAPYVQSLFARLGVEFNPGSPDGAADALAQAGFASYESFIEDLVKQRNDIAHSYGDKGMVKPEILTAYVDIVEAWLISIDRSVNASIISLLAQRSKIEPIGGVVKTWTGRVGIQMTQGRIATNDRLLLVKEGWCTSHLVESLQSNETSLSLAEVDATPIDVSVGIRSVPNNAENSTAYVIDNRWIEFWPSEEKPA